MSKIDAHARALSGFCMDSAEVEAFNLDRTTGENPAFAFIDAAGRLVLGLPIRLSGAAGFLNRDNSAC